MFLEKQRSEWKGGVMNPRMGIQSGSNFKMGWEGKPTNTLVVVFRTDDAQTDLEIRKKFDVTRFVSENLGCSPPPLIITVH